MRARTFYDTNSPGPCGVVEAWMKKWRPVITTYSEQLGCGRNHDPYEIGAPSEALAEFPPEILEKGEP